MGKKGTRRSNAPSGAQTESGTRASENSADQMCALNFELIFLFGRGMANRDQYLVEGLCCCLGRRLGLRCSGSRSSSKCGRNFKLRIKLWLRRIYSTKKIRRDWESLDTEMVDNGQSCGASFGAASVGATGSFGVTEKLSALEWAIKSNMETDRRYVVTLPGQLEQICAVRHQRPLAARRSCLCPT